MQRYRDISNRLLMQIDPLWRLYVRTQTQKDRHFRRSPIVAQRVGSRRRFAEEGPHAGDQAPDVAGLLEGESSVRLYDKLFGGVHTLLFFGGCSREEERRRAHYAEMEHGIESLPANLVRAVFVRRGDLLAPATWNGSLLIDPLGRAHARYGAAEECLYLIRPDGFVAFRCMPARWADMRAYLESVFLLEPA
jgi:hypothetical protein